MVLAIKISQMVGSQWLVLILIGWSDSDEVDL